MEGTSLYNFYKGKFSEQNTQRVYNMASFRKVYRSSGSSEMMLEELSNNIECGATSCRLIDDTGEIPDDIERCR